MVRDRREDQTLRERILSRDEFRCVYCAEVFPPEMLTLDHVQPKLRGGDRSPGNLVCACQTCNAEKGSAPAWAYLSERPEQRENFLRYAVGVWERHRRAIQEEVEKRREDRTS
jgi:HNH endonuclease